MEPEVKPHPSEYEIGNMSQSQLLRLAISDLKSLKANGVERHGKKYKVKEEGRTWVVLDPYKKQKECRVCLAGAVLVGVGHFYSPGYHWESSVSWAWKINDMRMGLYKKEDGSPNVFKPVAKAYRRAKKQMASIAKYEEFAEFLESKGL